jgi:hypothetical protein
MPVFRERDQAKICGFKSDQFQTIRGTAFYGHRTNARSSDKGFGPRPPERDEYLGSYRGSNDVDAPRGDGNAMLNSTARVDAKPKLVQRQLQPSLSFAIGIVDPNGHHARRTQAMDKPVERGFQCFDRVFAPGNHGNVIVPPGQAARSCAERIDETQTTQLKQHLTRRMTRDQQSVCPFCSRKRNQTMNYSLAL